MAEGSEKITPENSTKKSWGPFAAIFWALAVYLLPQIVVVLLLSIYPDFKHWSTKQANNWLSNSIPVQFVYTVLVETFAFVMIWGLLKYYRARFSSIGLKRAKSVDVMYALAGFGAYFALYLLSVGVISKLVPSLNVSQKQNVGFQNVVGLLPIAMAFVSLVVLPPIVEEIIFRGFVFTGFRRKYGFVMAALATSVLFGVPHLFEGEGGGLLWIAGIDTFILSFVLCFLREKTDRLWAGMAVHAMKNGLAFASIFFFHVH